VRVLGSFPIRGQLLGPIREALDLLARESGDASGSGSASASGPGFLRPTSLAPPPVPKAPDRLKIGVIGFGKFGQFLTRTFTKYHDVFVVSRDDMVRGLELQGGKASAPIAVYMTTSLPHFTCLSPPDGGGGGPGRQVLPAL
jgi:hypothetical protein